MYIKQRQAHEWIKQRIIKSIIQSRVYLPYFDSKTFGKRLPTLTF